MMKKQGFSLRLLTVAACLMLACQAYAIPVWKTAVGASDYSGSRGTGNGVTGFGSYASSFDLGWEVEQVGNLYHYEYTFSNLNKNLSHWLLQVSDNFLVTDISNVSTSLYSGDPQAYVPGEGGQSNAGLPATIFGFKFAGGPGNSLVYSFDSTRAPMWGNFFAKSGNGVHAYNNGLPTANSGSENILDFIAVPDTRTVTNPDPDPVVPEPATLSMIGLGLAGLASFSRRRRVRA